MLLTKQGECIKGLVFGGFFRRGFVTGHGDGEGSARGGRKIIICSLFYIPQIQTLNFFFFFWTHDPQQEIQLVSWSSAVVQYI